ncbi:unnamed protein product [Trichobilharzia regenti]|nr:unnamed protein product [Trichobilharzia regenti]
MNIHRNIPYSGIGDHLLRIEARDCGKPYRFTLAELIIKIDESESKAHLSGRLYHADDGVGSGFSFGLSRNKLNLYIIIAIVAAACIISTILLFLFLTLLRHVKSSRNYLNVADSENKTVRKSYSNNSMDSTQWHLKSAVSDFSKVQNNEGKLFSNVYINFFP